MPTLTPGQLHLWLTRPTELNEQYDRFLSYLSTDEQTRAAGYKLAAPRTQFILARGFLRQTLSSYVSAAPESLRFGTTGNEKPVLLNDGPLHFNLSHTANAIALVIANDRPVGVDVEQVQLRRSMDAIARQQFHPAERADWEAADESHKLNVFYRIWTCKEAYLKGLGRGFAQSLSSFALRPVGSRYVPSPALDDEEWSVTSEIEHDIALAVAAPGHWCVRRIVQNAN